MDQASEELERRSRYLSALVRRTRLADPPQPELERGEEVAEGKVDVVEPVLLKAAARVLEEGKGGKEGTKAKERAAAEANGQRNVAVCVRAADMPLPLQRRAVRIAVEAVAAMPRLESKRLALALKKPNIKHVGFTHCCARTEIKDKCKVNSIWRSNGFLPTFMAESYSISMLFWRLSWHEEMQLCMDFDTTYGPAWHCIVGTSFGSYVTHSLGGFLYFSVDKVYILLFRTAVEPLADPE